MRTTRIEKIHNSQEILKGSILIAKPFCENDFYKRSVILVLQNTVHGSTGILLNKTSTLNLSQVFPEIKHYLPVFYGGSTDTTLISYLHNLNIKNRIYIKQDLYLGGNFNEIKSALLKKKNPQVKLKFFAGFTEWKPGQLESEITAGKWWTGDLNTHQLFATAHNELWSKELINNGHVYGIFKEYPDPVLS